MRVIQVSKDGAIELNWMFLPTFIGQNYVVLKELETFWRKRYSEGVVFSDDALDEMSSATITWLAEKFSAIVGLRQYLEAIKYVEQEDESVHVQRRAG